MRISRCCALVLALAGCDGGGASDTGGDAGDPRPAVTDVQRSCPDPTELGCGMVRVSGSLEPFEMGHVGDPGDPNLLAGSVYVTGDVYVDTHEVTIARYRRFLAESDVTIEPSTPIDLPVGRVALGIEIEFRSSRAPAPPLPEEMGGSWTDAPGARESHPVIGVDWFSAMTFCYWDGAGRGRLPTEAEHEYLVRHRAADGLAPGRAFAWGDELVADCDRAQVAGCEGEDGAPTRPVGSFAPSGGLFDLTGNAEEWALDNYADYYPSACWNRTVHEDPVCLGGADYKSTRAGSHESEYYGGWRRTRRQRADRVPTVGFRCVRSLPRES